MRPRKPETKAEYRRIVRHVLVPCFGPKPLRTLEAVDAWQLVVQRMNGTAPVKGRCRPVVSLERALREMAVLRKMLSDAVRKQLIGQNPCLGLADELRDEFEHRGRPRVVLNEERLAALVAATPEAHVVLMRVLASCGLRLGEALALRVSSLDAAAGTLRVNASWSHSRVVVVKTDAGDRTLRLPPGVMAALVEHAAKAQGPDNREGWLFPGARRPDGRVLPLDPGHWRLTVFYPAARAAGLPEHTVPHSLRHSAAVAWLRGRPDAEGPERSVPGFSRARVQVLLGHASQASTERYTRMVPEDFGGRYDVFE